MPVSNTADPVLREIRRQNGQIRALKVAVVVLAILVPMAFAASLWLRASDLEDFTRRGNVATVQECFRSANQRASLLEVALDLTLSDTAREFAFTLWENTPTVRDCRELADHLHISPTQDTG